MADEDYEEATPEQKINIANYFVMSSPTGEVHDVVLDVAKLVDDPAVLTDGALKKIMREYNHQQLQPAKTPDGNSLVVSTHGAVGDDEYVDPSTGKVFKFDHRKHLFTEESENKQTLADEINSFRGAVDKELAGYNARQYKKDKCTMTVYGADDGKITICLSARNIHLPAFWSGGWKSVATFNCKESGSQEMKINTRIEVHYFEDGNVQLHAAIEKSPKINVTDAASTAESVVKALEAMESTYQSNMEEMYVDMHNVTVKAMRRQLPITKQPMSWNVAAHSIQLNST